MPKNSYNVSLQKLTEHKYTDTLCSNTNTIGNLDEKKYDVLKCSLMNKEDDVKHSSETKVNWADSLTL
jgi:hypothetical protein